jgi:hypothetical protein
MKGSKMKFRALEWVQIVGDENSHFTLSPAGRNGEFYIHYEEDLYWPSWSVDGGPFETLSEAQAFGQASHEFWLMKFLIMDS